MPRGQPLIEEILRRHKPISDQVEEDELAVILTELKSVLDAGVYGSVVELGCYAGTTSLFIRRLLDGVDKTRDFQVYDSFAGLPAKSAEDASPAGEQYQAGQLNASKSQFVNNFKKAGLAIPLIHKAWFVDLTDKDLPEAVCFAFLDGDFYGSIKASLKLVGPVLSIGGKIVIDDYQSESLPGVKKAVDEWLKVHPMRLRVEQSLAVIG
jgi:O-methyltransferase